MLCDIALESDTAGFQDSGHFTRALFRATMPCFLENSLANSSVRYLDLNYFSGIRTRLLLEKKNQHHVIAEPIGASPLRTVVSERNEFDSLPQIMRLGSGMRQSSARAATVSHL